MIFLMTKMYHILLTIMLCVWISSEEVDTFVEHGTACQSSLHFNYKVLRKLVEFSHVQKQLQQQITELKLDKKEQQQISEFKLANKGQQQVSELKPTRKDPINGHVALKLANSYGDHMVLQRGPQRAILWGYAGVVGDTVTVTQDGQLLGTTVVIKNPNAGATGIWKLKLPAETNPGPHTIHVTSSEGTLVINDVMYGDVWMCSGQSNMQFTMKEVHNHVQEIEDSLQYTNIRMLFSKLVTSASPVDNVVLNVPWVKPTKGFIENFSALCFMFARDLQKTLNCPIGLIESNWGGTPIEYWSSPDAFKACPNNVIPIPSHSSLWNSMIHPFLKTTIKGVIWYQGEANANRPDLYKCQFPAMINDWRQKFNNESEGETNIEFPFGFVQLAPWRAGSIVGGFPALRWAQTTNIGHVPNSNMKKTFMAVAIDLPDFKSPSGAIHPTYKQDVAARLVLGARAVAYGESNIVYQGPFPSDFQLDTTQRKLTIIFDHGAATLEVKSGKEFEVCCSTSETSDCSSHVTWEPAQLTGHHGSTVELYTSHCPAGQYVAGVRYLWRESPCQLKLCPLYSMTSNLPAPPFIKTGGFMSSGVIIG